MRPRLVSEDEVREICGRKFVEQRRQHLESLLIRSFGGSPRHNKYHNSVALSVQSMRQTFGQAGATRLLMRYFVRVGKHLQGKWSTGFRLNPNAARRVEEHLLRDDPLSRKPFAPTIRPVADTGLSFPDSLPVDLAQLERTLDTVRAALRVRGEDCYYAASLGSSQSLGALYRQLLAVRRTVIETGGLPSTYVPTKDGRWAGEHDHHPLRLPRPTRFLALGERADLWDVDLSNAHLAIALGLFETAYPEFELPMLRAYLHHRSEWLDALCRTLPGVSLDDAKGVARAWLYGSKRTNPGSQNAVIRAPRFPATLEGLKVWDHLYTELRRAAELLTLDSPLPVDARDGTRLSYLLTGWETRIMGRLGKRLLDAGVKLEAWLYDGFLLIQSRADPTERLEGFLHDVARDLLAEGYRFDSLGLKARNVEGLYADVSSCLSTPTRVPTGSTH